MPSQTDWENVLLAFLHDPPDKALGIRDHVSRARRYLAEALSRPFVEREELKTPSDPLAAQAERTPAPHWEKVSVAVQGGRLATYHPLVTPSDGDPGRQDLAVGEIDEALVTEVIRGIVDPAGDDPARRFLALWRLLPERLAARRPEFARLPADTRIPDHTIWHHLDTTAGLAASDRGARGRAFLSFSLGPVQSFIAGARTVRDLWTGSMILSYLTFQAMLPVIEELGPTALVYPALRGVPLVDLWLRRQGLGLRSDPDPDLRKSPCLPNRFLALVPWGPDGRSARALADHCEQAGRRAWCDIAGAVHGALDATLAAIDQGWDRRWNDQVADFFEFRTALLPWWDATDKVLAELRGANSFAEAFPAARAVRRLAEAIPGEQRPRYPQDQAGLWQARVDLSAALMQATRSVRHVPRYQAGLPAPPKCSLLGTYEQMGPDGLDDSRRFWEAAREKVACNGVRLRERDRLCAVSLVKRFAGPCFLGEQLGFSREESRQLLRYDDTATVAAAGWLHEAQQRGYDRLGTEGERDTTWSGQWLHWPRKDFDQGDRCPDDVWEQIGRAKRDLEQKGHGLPPTYYAVLMLDGDDLGGWLGGRNSPELRHLLHPDLRKYFENLPGTEEGLKARRPVGPALHAALSTALANFALHVVPKVVSEHNGVLIYSGGDDTLALLPARRALDCALALRDRYRRAYDSESGRELLLMGPQATLSGGLAVVHYKEDLRLALDAARGAEKAAKKAGKDALQVAVCRRSGEHSTALCPWDFVEPIRSWVDAFEKGASDRWAYHLKAQLPTLRGLPSQAMAAAVRRQLDRAEDRTRHLLPAGDLVRVFEDYRAARHAEGRRPKSSEFLQKHPTPEEHDQALDGEALDGFLTLCQSASFLARGRDQ